MPLTAKLNAKPNATKADFKAAGCTDAELAALEKFIQVNGISWATLWALVVQYGPQIVAFIISVLTPAPAPTPAP